MDALRVVSALSVVLIHAVNPVTFSYGQVPVGVWAVSNTLNVLGRASVPLFVMLSGALLLHPSRQTEPASIMFKKRLMRIITLYLIWSVIYFAWRAFGLHESLTLQSMITDFLAGTPGEQLYFLPIIAGLYVVTPLLRAAIWSLPLRQVARYTAVVIGMAAIWWLIGSLPGHSPSFNILNQFVPFIGYYLLGYVLTQTSYQPSRRSMWGLYSTGVVAPVVLTFLFASHVVPVYSPYFLYDFINPLIAMQAIGAWFIVQRYYPQISESYPRLRRVVAYVAGATLSLYLTHIIVLQCFASYILQFPAAQHPFLYLCVQVGVAGPLAVLVAVLIKHLPLARRLVT
jgi:surface polysaccharide O-acyltransferase-like enzyme